ncbi:hypothetical protein [Bacillus cereus group sp. BfR-BA-01356]|uniref:hypothetical protein n=1 Tax=Bacillus cereus group sp. BfR-BA-01356 TaxID=2920319 RepID=UPI001F573CBC
MIEEKVKSVMVPYLENYDYSNYITKLDSVLVDILKSSALENKQLLSNFQELMIPAAEKTIKVTDLFEKWKEHVEQNVETDGLEVDYDDEPTYEYVDVRFEVAEDDDRDWSSFKYATLVFECDHDEKMNFAIRLSKWKSRSSEGWDMQYDNVPDLKSLRNLNSFELLLMKMNQDRTQIILDEIDDSDSIIPEERPELSY